MPEADDPQPIRPHLVDDAVDGIGDVEPVLHPLGVGQLDVGADGLGFIGETARCDPGNPPAAVVRTAKSLAVVCQNLSGSYYYRGERIRDGAHIELSNAERVEDGFDVTNPVDGVVYEVRPNRLRIISFGHVDSSEPVLQYATAS